MVEPTKVEALPVLDEQGDMEAQPAVGIGGIFNTRTGKFQYKISLYIIIYIMLLS